MRSQTHTTICILATLLAAASTVYAIPAFPGAEGFGATALGGRGGDVYHVTTLSDTGAGSLRYGITNAPTSGRTIVFDVSGTISLSSQITMEGGKITLAGQTAPGQGICIKKSFLFLDNDCDDTIIRHIRSRLGSEKTTTVDAITVAGGNRVILDHCSTSWGSDETLSVVERANNVTIQWSTVTEGLNNKGHGYGSLIRPEVNSNVTIHHSLYAHNYSRNPRPGSYNGATTVLDFRNNVIYDWGDQAGYGCYATYSPPELLDMNYVGNYLVAGPSTDSGELSTAFTGYSYDGCRIYQSGNVIDPDRDGVFDGTNTGWAMFGGSFAPMGTAFGVAAVTTESAEAARGRVLNEAGAFPWNRDPVDTRVIGEVRSGTGHIINYESEVGGYPTYPYGTYTLSYDTDRDGMPNTWETARGLNTSVADNNGDDDADGYTNLEEYLHSLAPIPAPKPIVWTGGTGRYELITNWDIPWQPYTYDQAEINSGKATVAYIGQHGGTLTVANTASSSGELAVTAGSLALANRLILGNASGAKGTASLTGGSLTAGGAIVLAQASSSTGKLTVAKGAYVKVGGLTVNTGSGRSSTIGVEVDASGNSLIRTTAASTLGGAMDVQVLGGWRPKEGDTFAVISSTDPNGVHYTGNFSTFTSNITTGLPGSSAFGGGGGGAGGAYYELVFVGYTYGDANGDHIVDGGDLALIGGSWTQSGKVWGNGEFTGEGTVDGGDLALLGGNWNWSLPGGAPVVPVPEPASLVLLAGASTAVFIRRNRP